MRYVIRIRLNAPNLQVRSAGMSGGRPLHLVRFTNHAHL